MQARVPLRMGTNVSFCIFQTKPAMQNANNMGSTHVVVPLDTAMPNVSAEEAPSSVTLA